MIGLPIGVGVVALDPCTIRITSESVHLLVEPLVVG